MRNRVYFAPCLLIGTVLVSGPGAVAQPAAGDLKLPVPRTFDLTHVEAKHYAVALGKDPVKIFEFVRDQIGYEVYTGALRGPRGTLLAMAGNSVDRAALLASLLKESGHRLQFVRGTLPKIEAQKLVDSMWLKRPSPAPTKVEPSPAIKTALATLASGVKRDYTLIRDHLKRANVTPSPVSAPSLDSLVQEAQEHYWVQWWSDNEWVDLDPSFAGATPGRKYAQAAGAPVDALPDALFHRVAIRIRLEEYTGDQPSSRVILTHAANAADLSGVDLVLSHQPENWKGPAVSLASALASAITNTGRVKPVMIIGAQHVMGEAFRQTAPTNVGVGGVTNLLSGAGTRTPVPIATAETIEFEFIYPGGRKETVVREIFDLVGMARRSEKKTLTAEEVRSRSSAKNAMDVTAGIYDMFVTTGRIVATHVQGVVREKPGSENEPVDVPAGLRRINVLFTVISDMLLPRVEGPGRGTVLFYPDSPRLSITELLSSEESERIALDLRRDHARAVAVGFRAEDLFRARVLRGVIEGTLERVLVGHLTRKIHTEDPSWAPVVSTSSLFERLRTDGTTSLRLPREVNNLDGKIPGEAMARVRADLASEYLIIAPKVAVEQDGVLRYAWWRIDPRSGETTAVTDEGVYQAATENVYVTRDRETGVIRVWRQVGGRWTPYQRTWLSIQQDSLYDFLWTFHPDANWIFGISVV